MRRLSLNDRSTRVLITLVWACTVTVGAGYTVYGATPTKMNERAWAEKLAPKYNAEVEVRIWDDTRCDLLNAEYAIEVDWAPKWAEAVGQALYYSIALDRKPAVLLLVIDKKKERRYVYRAQSICAKYGIKLYVEKAHK